MQNVRLDKLILVYFNPLMLATARIAWQFWWNAGKGVVQLNLDMTDSMGPGKLVRHMQNPSYTYDEYLICIRLGPSILSVICKNPSYSGPSYLSSPVVEIFEVEIFIRFLPITLLQIFWYFILNSQVIVKIIVDVDGNFSWNPYALMG